MITSVLVFEMSVIDKYGMIVSDHVSVPFPDKLLWKNRINFATFEEWRNSSIEYKITMRDKLIARGAELFPDHSGSGWRYEATVIATTPVLNL